MVTGIIYAYFDADSFYPLYVGKSCGLFNQRSVMAARQRSHLKTSTQLAKKLQQSPSVLRLRVLFSHQFNTKLQANKELATIERSYIQRLRPHFNVKLKY